MHRILISRQLSVLLMACFVTVISGCASKATRLPWPSELPDRELFVSGLKTRLGQATVDEKKLNYHLGWIKKFYLGTTLYPNGWLSASDQFVASIESEAQKASVLSRMQILGVTIANEWAQDNKIRLINSANISTWADALRTAAERDEQIPFISEVEKDVTALISGDLTAREIKYQRYFSDEIYDDF